MPIPVIDLFAGPGGLGEGFSALRSDGRPVFKIGISIEKDPDAHQTLELRAFFRQFPDQQAPAEYYDYLAGRLSREGLFKKFPEEAGRAELEAWHAELGAKDLSPEAVEERLCLALGKRKKWVLIGGPPCQAYSLVGRSRMIGGEGIAKYEANPKHRLYEHYLRIVSVLQPPIFVMENVKGLLSAEVKKERIFERILADLRHPLSATLWAANFDAKLPLEYQLLPLTTGAGELFANARQSEPEDFVVRAEDFGIPQARHRIIILGVRSDLTVRQAAWRQSQKVTVEEIIGDLPRLRSGLSKEPDSAENWQQAVRETINASWVRNGVFPNDFREMLFRMSQRVGANLGRGGRFLEGISIPAKHAAWFFDKRLKGVCNHETRGHIREDLQRYFFAAVFAKKFGRSPLLEDFPAELLPNHENVEQALKETKFNDRFRVQRADHPATTVVSHISKDGHYYIHYDPSQCRSLTVREAARLQTFPDNYFFEGPRTEQYQQVGNAVPPLLALRIAEIVADMLK